MCITPNFVWVELGSKWVQQPMACRQCWRCKENRVNDYIGRAMAEASVSETTCTLSLTYAPRDDLADKVLTPHHFQLFMKLLRRAGHKVRYLVAGEYGDLKARSHFHAILFFTDLRPLAYEGDEGEWIVRGQTPRHQDDYQPGTLPKDWGPFCREIPQKRMVHIREWPHGHIKCDWSADERAARYVCKYLLADNKQNAWFSVSKKPALGAAWFAQKAEVARNLSVMPSTFNYVPPGSTSGKTFLMTGATRRDYLNAISTDERVYPRLSEWVGKSFRKQRQADDRKARSDLLAVLPDYAQVKLSGLDLAAAADKWKRDKSEDHDRYLAHWLSKSRSGILFRWRGKMLPAEEIERREIKERVRYERKKARRAAFAADREGLARSVNFRNG